MYLMYYALAFAIFAIPKPDRFVWIGLCVLCVTLECNTLLTENDIYRVLARCTIITSFAFTFLYKKTMVSCYQAFILLLFLVANLSLAYDVANQQHIIIYNNFEVVIYGLVSCQFVGILPKIWNILCNYYSSRDNRGANSSVGETI